MSRNQGSIQAPERALQADLLEVVTGACGLAALIAGFESTVVPVRGEAPERGQVHDIARLHSRMCRPALHALEGTEEALVAAGVDDVVPGPGHGNEEMRHLVAGWRRFAIDDPGQGSAAARA